MSAFIRSRSRFTSIIKCGNRRSFWSASADPQSSEKKPWRFVKYGILGALTGGAATAGYVSYVYPLEEIDERTKAFRASANFTIEDNASFSDKVQGCLRTATVKVPAKLIDLYINSRRLAEAYLQWIAEPIVDKLLPDLHPLDIKNNVITIVLDLDETLIYTDWKRDRGWRTLKRPGVDDFLARLAQYYEIVVYSDQSNEYVDPVIERLNTKDCIRFKLARNATRYVKGKHYRDLSKLNRDPAKVIYISGHALETSLQPENSVEIKPWRGEADDTALLDLIPFFDYVAIHTPADIRTVIASYQGRDIAKQFIERYNEHERVVKEQKQQGPWWRRR